MTARELTTAEVADLFGVSESAVHEWASDDRLPYQWGRRRYPAVAELAKDRTIPLPDWLCGTAASAQREAP